MNHTLKTSIFAAIIALTTSCSDPKKVEDSTHTDVGTLPDGREIKCITRDAGNYNLHYIYYVENPDGEGHTVSTTYRAGKTDRTAVVIDGVKYVPIED